VTQIFESPVMNIIYNIESQDTRVLSFQSLPGSYNPVGGPRADVEAGRTAVRKTVATNTYLIGPPQRLLRLNG
jgi:hypothetical protein